MAAKVVEPCSSAPVGRSGATAAAIHVVRRATATGLIELVDFDNRNAGGSIRAANDRRVGTGLKSCDDR